MVGDFLSRCKPGGRSRVNQDRMGKDTASIRTLLRALATIGSEEHLAAALDIVARGGLRHHGS